MNWQMWLLVGLLVFILAILSALALIMHAQNRRIARLSGDLKKSIDTQDSLEKTLQRSLEGHSARLIGTTEHLKFELEKSQALTRGHEEATKTALSELEIARSEVKKLKSILARKERRVALQPASQEIPNRI